MPTLTITQVIDSLWQDIITEQKRIVASGLSEEAAARAIAADLNNQFSGLRESPIK